MIITEYKGRRIDPLKPVFAYRNLHQAKWSLRQGGLVVAHADSVMLFRCKLKVSEAGRQRVLREGKKNVHAGVVGIVADVEDLVLLFGERKKLSYNPFKSWRFEVDGYPVNEATYVQLDNNGKAWAFGAE